MAEHGVVAVEESITGSIEASAAWLHLGVQGENFFYGRAALEKAKELRELIVQLKAAGLGEDAIDVQGVTMTAKSGILSQSSRCRYQLLVRVADLSRMSEVLGAIAGSKNAALEMLEWRYDGEFEAKLALVASATERVAAKASAIARVLGVRVLGPKRVSDRVHLAQREPVRFGELAAPAARMRAAPVDIGTVFAHRSELRVEVSAEFWVEAAPAGALERSAGPSSA
jgi:uncharacterized protein YggE